MNLAIVATAAYYPAVSYRFIAPGECPSIKRIQAAVSAYFNLPQRIMTTHSRYRSEARPRQIAMYLARHLTGNSLPMIGRHFAGRDHTTVMHAVKAIETLCVNDAGMAADVACLRGRLA